MNNTDDLEKYLNNCRDSMFHEIYSANGKTVGINGKGLFVVRGEPRRGPGLSLKKNNNEKQCLTALMVTRILKG